MPSRSFRPRWVTDRDGRRARAIGARRSPGERRGALAARRRGAQETRRGTCRRGRRRRTSSWRVCSRELMRTPRVERRKSVARACLTKQCRRRELAGTSETRPRRTRPRAMATATGTSARSHPLWSPPSVRARGCAKFDGVAPRPPRRVHPGGPHRTFRDGVARRAAGDEAWSATRGDASTSNLSNDADTERVVFLGDDRAAFTAAIYAARAGLDPVVFETMEGVEEAWDGEEAFVSSLEKQTRVRDAMRAQATKSGAACHPRDDPVTNVDVSEGPPFTVRTKRGVVLSARTLVVSEACAIALSLSSANDAAKEKTRSSVRGAFVARGSGFAAGLAAERWHGPVRVRRPFEPDRDGVPETARKVRAAVADVSRRRSSEREGRRRASRRDARDGFSLGKKSASSSSLISTPRGPPHRRGRVQAAVRGRVCAIGTRRRCERGNARRIAQERPPGTTAGLKTKTKTDETVFALAAFFGAEARRGAASARCSPPWWPSTTATACVRGDGR